MKTVSIFCDTGNLYHCINKKFPGRRLNYKKYLSLIEGTIERKVAYGTYMNPGVYDFERSLKRAGWETHFTRPRSQGTPFDWSVAIALEVYECISEIVVLGSSGHEYLPLVQKFSSEGFPELQIIACGINRSMSKLTKTIEIGSDSLTDVKSDILQTVTIAPDVKIVTNATP